MSTYGLLGDISMAIEKRTVLQSRCDAALSKCAEYERTITLQVETIDRLRADNARKEGLLRVSQVHVKQARAAVATDKPISEARARMNAAREEAMRTGTTVRV